MRERYLAVGVLVAGLGMSTTAHAQLEPVGPQMVVNAYTTGWQALPSLSFGPDGGVLVVWTSLPDSSQPDASIVGRRFGLDGSPLGGDFVIDTGTSMRDRGPHLARTDGGFLLGWTRQVSDEVYDLSARVRPLDATGTAVGAEVALDAAPLYRLRLMGLERGADDRFLAVWEHSGDAPTGTDVDARLLDAAGSPVGASFRVNEASAYALYPAVAPLGASGYVVVWRSILDGDPFAEGVAARRLGPGGAPIGAEFLVATSTRPLEHPAVAGRPDGSFVVTWAGMDPVTVSLQDVFARRFDAAGAPLGGAFQVNLATTGEQRYPTIATDPTGAFHVVWGSAAEDAFAFDDEVGARSFDAAGQPLGGELTLGSGLRAASRPELRIDASGSAWAAWTDGLSIDGWDGIDGDESGVVARPAWVAGRCRDLDGDGYGAPGAADCAAGPATDCDDGDAAVNPGAVEIPANGIDDDCDPSTPSGCNAEEL